MAKRASEPKAKANTPTPLDLSAEYQTAEEVAGGDWVNIRLPSGAEFPCKIARAIGGHFARVVLSVRRKWTRNGKKELSDAEITDSAREVMAKANFLDIGGPVLVRQKGTPDRVVDPGCKWQEREFLLSVYPDLQLEIANAASEDGKAFTEMVAEVGEG